MKDTVAKKLKALENLQAIDSKLDEVKKIRGVLPEEVQDLENEIAGYETRIGKQIMERKTLEESIVANKTVIKNAETLIAKYGEQQMNVRNNREYDAITKEMELQQLEIEIRKKKIVELSFGVTSKNEETEKNNAILVERSKDLSSKKEELEAVLKESEEDEQKMEKNRIKAIKNVEEKLLIFYNRARQNMRNGLAVVPVKRGACGGCFNAVPPQKQAEIREKKNVIVCEHCGRILSNVQDVVEEPTPKPKRRTTRKSAEKSKNKKS